MIDNIYAPFSIPFHIIFCVIATIFYLYMYNKKGYRHYMYLIFAIDFTFFSQVFPNKTFMFFLGIVEIILLVLIFTSMIKVSKKNKLAQKNAINNTDNTISYNN